MATADVLPVAEPLSGTSYSAVELSSDAERVWMLDQRLLPARELYVELTSVKQVAEAIRDMVVRGAPAIGISAAYGMVLAARRGEDLKSSGELLCAARPTAVNLAWAVERCLAQAAHTPRSDVIAALTSLSREIHRADVQACRTMGRLGQERIPDGATVLTHCNAGALATGGYGTALGVIRAAKEAGKRIRVVADETRPYLQGSRLTAWELSRDGIEVDVIPDGAAGHLFSQGLLDLAVVGSDRIAANGDVANKIGTFSVAVLAQYHQRPLYVAAPWSTVDLACPSGERIPIEQRSRDEVARFCERELLPDAVGVKNPAFDVTPAKLVTAIFTERGIVEPVNAEQVARLAPEAGA